MISIDGLLGIIWTEALEGGTDEHGRDISQVPSFDSTRQKKAGNLPAIRYDLELIRKPDGTYEWVE